MVVLERKDTPTKPHYHPAPKSETFQVHEGSLRVTIFSADLCPTNQYSLEVGEILRIPDFVVHWVRPSTPYCIYSELKLGPKDEIDSITPRPFMDLSVIEIEALIKENSRYTRG
jgi:cupin fold WbuC family metalloprotein